MNDKRWLSLDAQVQLLRDRGLEVGDEAFCREILRKVGYYHLSGYWRFFQIDPTRGDNNYRTGTTFETIAGIQNLDAQLRQLCFDQLVGVELALRTGFAYHFGEHVSAYGALLNPTSWSPTGPHRSVDEQIRADLDQSKQQFVIRHRVNGGYPSLPVWVAVEAMAFGTLSKAIAHCEYQQVVNALADDLGVKHTGFSSQIRSLVALRNACAHLTRLWNDVSKNPPQVPSNVLRRARKAVGQFDPHSYYHVLVALDHFSQRTGPDSDFLSRVGTLIEADPLFRRGLMNPEPYR